MEVEQYDEAEERQVQEEFNIWRKNTPFLYDMVITHALEWPSLTVQWMPERKEYPEQGYSKQRILLGTHTSDNEQNYLTLADVQLPLESTEFDPRQYDAEKGEVGGFSSDLGKITILVQIPHEGEVNRARYNPRNSFLIATKTVSSDVYIFDYSKHPSKPEEDICNPQIRLKGHTAEGYGLDWCPVKDGMIASGSDDQQVCVWDIKATPQNGIDIQPLITFRDHNRNVEDVAWHSTQENILASCGDDRRLIIYDIRERRKAKEAETFHKHEINAVSFNPKQEYLLTTGSADKIVAIYDLRNMKAPIHFMECHQSEVFQVVWHPKCESVLASAGADRRVLLYDLSKIGSIQTPEEAEDGPPELIFIHGGHTAKVSDVAWNPNDDCSLASVAEDNIIQLWQPIDTIFMDEEQIKQQQQEIGSATHSQEKVTEQQQSSQMEVEIMGS
eukprot:TRINITY_DN15501_c1_g1_i4.p1 TRINITY_DN15501_c1_g1~~TRINITY_DN15501_c1_g1_i4.p1  ORF type:complete len:454 (+),score=49.10 TRINITY_DN15501_c1_g1_i4:32-1363(+)